MKIGTVSYHGIIFIVSLLLISSALSPLVKASADTCIWTGGGADKLASNALNWTGCDSGGVPENGDSLEFPASAAPQNADPILFNSNLSVAGINFTGSYPSGDASYDYMLGGAGVIDLSGPITNSTDRSYYINTDIVLGQSVVITNSTSGSSTVFGDNYNSLKTLNIGSHNITFIGSGSVRIFSNIVGSGTISMSKGGYISGNNNGFTGTIMSIDDRSNLFFDRIDAIKGTIDVAAKGTISLNILRADSISIDASIILNGAGYEYEYNGNSYTEPALYLIIYGESSNPSAVEFTNTSLNADSSIKVFAKYDDTIKFTGPGLGSYKINPSEGSQGKLIIDGEIIRAKPTIITHSDEQTYSEWIYDNTILIINGKRGDITINKGGVLKGTGTVGAIDNAGTLAPGLSPGILNSGNFTATGGTFESELGGTTPGNGSTNHDQLNVTGTVDLGSATTLSVTHWNNFRPALNNQFVIINNDGTDAVTGTFQGLAQGATLTVDGVTYTISYTGGTGNDVVLTATSVPATPEAPNTGFETLTSNPVLTLAITGLALGLIYGAKIISV